MIGLENSGMSRRLHFNTRLNLKTKLIFLMVIVFFASISIASESSAEEVLMVSGRWDNIFSMVDIQKAVNPDNDGTSNAIFNQLRYTPDDKEGRTMGGQGINLAIPPDSRYAYAIDHGRMTADELEAFYRGETIQHGFKGYIVIFDLKKALNPDNDMTLNAVDEFVPTGGFGPTGISITPDGKHAFIAHAEQKDSEDGGRIVKIMDLETREMVGEVTQEYGDPGFACPPSRLPVGAPDPNFGCFPLTNGIALTPDGDYLFTGNGGTQDVGVIDVQLALAGDPKAEINRIDVPTGPFGVAMSPDGKYFVSANRESQRTGEAGNTISIIDVEKAIAKDRDAVVATVMVGTNDPDVATRPFHPVFIDGGKRILVSNFKSNNVSVVNLQKAIDGQAGAEVRRIPVIAPGDGTDPSMPRGITITNDEKYAAITGDGPPTGESPKGGPGSSVLYMLDLEKWEVVSRVTGIGQESYFSALVPDNIVDKYYN